MNRTIETINAELRGELLRRSSPTVDPVTLRLMLDTVLLLATTRAIEIVGNHTASVGSIDQFRLMLADLGNLRGAFLSEIPSALSEDDQRGVLDFAAFKTRWGLE